MALYIMPTAVSGTPPARRPKYLSEFGPGPNYSSMDYGHEDIMIVSLENPSAAVHTLISSHADVIALPDLSQNVGAQRDAVRSKLEAFNIPAQWVQAAHSYGSVLRVVAVFFQMAQRLQGLGHPRLLNALDTQFGFLTQVQRDGITAMAAHYSFDVSGIFDTTTVRQIWRQLATQWATVQIVLGSQVL